MGVVRSLDVALSAAERAKLSDGETLLLVRAYRMQLHAMSVKGDTEPPFLDRAVAATLQQLAGVVAAAVESEPTEASELAKST